MRLIFQVLSMLIAVSGLAGKASHAEESPEAEVPPTLEQAWEQEGWGTADNAEPTRRLDEFIRQERRKKALRESVMADLGEPTSQAFQAQKRLFEALENYLNAGDGTPERKEWYAKLIAEIRSGTPLNEEFYNEQGLGGKEAMTPLAAAVRGGNLKHDPYPQLVRLLIRKGADPNPYVERGHLTPLAAAAFNASAIDIQADLGKQLAAHADRDPWRHTQDHLAVARILVENGADVEEAIKRLTAGMNRQNGKIITTRQALEAASDLPDNEKNRETLLRAKADYRAEQGALVQYDHAIALLSVLESEYQAKSLTNAGNQDPSCHAGQGVAQAIVAQREARMRSANALPWKDGIVVTPGGTKLWKDLPKDYEKEGGRPVCSIHVIRGQDGSSQEIPSGISFELVDFNSSSNGLTDVIQFFAEGETPKGIHLRMHLVCTKVIAVEHQRKLGGFYSDYFPRLNAEDVARNLEGEFELNDAAMSAFRKAVRELRQFPSPADEK